MGDSCQKQTIHSSSSFVLTSPSFLALKMIYVGGINSWLVYCRANPLATLVLVGGLLYIAFKVLALVQRERAAWRDFRKLWNIPYVSWIGYVLGNAELIVLFMKHLNPKACKYLWTGLTGQCPQTRASVGRRTHSDECCRQDGACLARCRLHGTDHWLSQNCHALPRGHHRETGDQPGTPEQGSVLQVHGGLARTRPVDKVGV